MEFPQHSRQLLSALRSQQQRGFLCDCAIVVGSSRFLAHRAVLASCSPFFQMYYSDPLNISGANASGSSVTLDGDIVTAAAFSLLLDFVYEGVLELKEASPVEDILAAASFLHMNEVVRVCKSRLRRRGPLAEADSTRCEESTGSRKLMEREDEGDGGTEFGVVSMAVDHLKPITMTTSLSQAPLMARRSPSEFVKSEYRNDSDSSETQVQPPPSPDLADTTQPGMDAPPQLLCGGQPAQGGAVGQSEGPDGLRGGSQEQDSGLCSPCSTTEYSNSVNQQPSSSSRFSEFQAGQSEDQDSIFSTFQNVSDTGSASVLHRLETEIDDCGHPKVKVEAIVISDEEEYMEQYEASGPMADMDDNFDNDIQDEELNPHPCRQMTGDHSFSSSPLTASFLQPPLTTPESSEHQASFLTDFRDTVTEDVPTCCVCGKTFSCTYTLRRHAIVHTKERPYECRFCYRRYTQSGDLYRHLRKIHDQPPPPKRSKTDVD
ncbi:zinc finger and BTB domain-containing protein 3 [Stigmatopora argus]